MPNNNSELQFTPQDSHEVFRKQPNARPAGQSSQEYHPLVGERQSRAEQENKIKQRGKLMTPILAALVAFGVFVAPSLANNASFDKESALRRAQAKNIEASTILQNNHIGVDDIEYSTEFGNETLSFDLDDVQYELQIDADYVDTDKFSEYVNIDGGIYKGTATYQSGDKTITKTFKAKDNDYEDYSTDVYNHNSGVSIDEALIGLGYDSSQIPQNVVQ